MKEFPSTAKNSVALLTPYKSQVEEILAQASSELSKAQMQQIEISTVDGFQVLPLLHVKPMSFTSYS